MSTAGDRIRRERARRRWTQQQLSEFTGVSVVTISRIETGRKYDTPRSIKILEAALGIGEYADDTRRSWSETLADAPAHELAAEVMRRLHAAEQARRPVDIPDEAWTEPGTLLPDASNGADQSGTHG